MRISIINAALFDPARSLSGEEGELHIEDARIVEHTAEPELVIDARGGPVMAGGIELDGTLASPLMVARIAAGELKPLEEAALSYALMGYTHINVRRVPLWAAGAAHYWLARLKALDGSVEPLFNLSDLDLLIRDEGGVEKGLGHGAFVLKAAGGIGLSVAEPFVRYRKEYLTFRQADAAECITYMAGLAEGLGLPVSVAYTPELKESLTPEAAGLIHLSGVSKKDALDIKGFFEAGGAADVSAQRPFSGLALEAGLFDPVRCAGGEPYFHEHGRVALAGLPETSDQGAVKELLEAADPAALALATRTVPAGALGLLPEKGTLAPGSLADVTVFGPEGDLTRCRYLVKSGVVVVDDYRPTGLLPETRTYLFSPEVAAEPAGEVPGSFRRENLIARPESFGPIKEVRRDVGD